MPNELNRVIKDVVLDLLEVGLAFDQVLQRCLQHARKLQANIKKSVCLKRVEGIYLLSPYDAEFVQKLEEWHTYLISEWCLMFHYKLGIRL
jgi:hypothetical protein